MEHNCVVSHIKDYPMGPILNGMVTDELLQLLFMADEN